MHERLERVDGKLRKVNDIMVDESIPIVKRFDICFPCWVRSEILRQVAHLPLNSVDASKINHHPKGFELIHWCEANIEKGHSCSIGATFFFTKAEDAVMFKLMFSEYL